MLRAELRQITEAFLTEFGDMGLERLDGEEAAYDRMREALESMPFLAPKKLVVLRNPGSNKEFVENAEKLITNLPDTTDLIIIETRPDKRTAYYKLLAKMTDLKEFPQLDEYALKQWLQQAAKERGGSIDSAVAGYLIDCVGADQMMLSNELQKLLNYDKNVSKQTIDLLCERSPKSTIFELLDAALTGKQKQMMQLYAEQRSLRVEPQQIIAMLAWQLHILALVSTAGQRSDAEIAKAAKLNPYVVSKTRRLAAKLSRSDVKQMIHKLAELDTESKTSSIDVDDALQAYLLTISQ